MRLYDTLTRSDHELDPIDGSTFRFYCCGPTVYGPAHIGNFRTFVLQDVLRRTLETGGMRTLHVRNITDVDDKTIRDSIAAGKNLKDFTDHWTRRYHEDCEALGILEPHIEPSAVEHIPQQIRMAEILVDRGHAYQSEDGSLYFRISSFPEYGKLAHLDQQELDLGRTQNQRANSDEYSKDSLSDFALWKARRPEDGDNYWPSPWGDGRPGWHLECSAMILEYLGESFDLHSGGVDLIFPHHENEIAQSTCSTDGSFAGHWFHTAHLLVDGGKMSKSLGNLYTLADLIERGFTPMEVRYVLISGHYRKQLNFTLDSLHAAREALQRLAKGARHLAVKSEGDILLDEISFGPFEPAWEALNNDLNTPAAIGCLFTGMKTAAEVEGMEAAAALAGFNRILRALGISLPDLDQASVDIPEDVRSIADSRWQARSEKNWAESDRLRDQLDSMGWAVKDGKDDYELSPK